MLSVQKPHEAAFGVGAGEECTFSWAFLRPQLVQNARPAPVPYFVGH